jgi:integrase/recombinase XerC
VQIPILPTAQDDIARIIDAWLVEKTPSYGDGTPKKYRGLMQKFRAQLQATGRDLDPNLWADQADKKAWRLANAFLVAEIQKFALRRYDGKTEPTTDNTRRAHLGAIGSFYEFALRYDFFEGFTNPVDKIKRPKAQAVSPTQPLDVAQVFRAIRAIDRTTARGARDYALFFIFFETSRRASEVLSLCWGDVQLVGTLDEIRDPADIQLTLTFRHCKGNKPLYHVLSRPASSALLACGARCYEINPLGLDKKRPVWKSFAPGREALTYRGARTVCERHFGEGNGQLHRIRHTVARECEKEGMSLREIQELLGHTRIETTMLYLGKYKRSENSVALSLHQTFGFQ